jgi:hypothetical protein
MNAHLTIRPVIAAAALASVIGMTSALSVAQTGEASTQSTTMGAAGPYQPSPYVDYDNTWLTGTKAWNAERAMGSRRWLPYGRVDASTEATSEHLRKTESRSAQEAL